MQSITILMSVAFLFKKLFESLVLLVVEGPT